jgi:hypothetical protein
MPISNAESQRRWRRRNNAYAAIARNELSGPAKNKLERLEAEHLKATAAWVKHLNAVADWRGHLQQLKDAPPGAWRSEQQSEALRMLRHHEGISNAYHTLLKSLERELRAREGLAESLAKARQILGGAHDR